MDIDLRALARTERLARRLVDTHGLPATINPTTDRATALEGAQFVLVCFQYPDKDGGNLSKNCSASADLSPGDAQRAAPLFAAHSGRGVALALPEVPLDARQALLELASDPGWLRLAAAVPDELNAMRNNGMLTQVDVLALNIEEAATLGGTSTGQQTGEVATAAVVALAALGSPAQVVLSMDAAAAGHGTVSRSYTSERPRRRRYRHRRCGGRPPVGHRRLAGRRA